MSQRVQIPTEGMEVELTYVPMRVGAELRTAGGQTVAGIPADVLLSRRDCTILFQAWLRTGTTLDWRATARTLAGIA